VRFAFVTPRYGADIDHGAEHACRLLAEQVCERHDVDVLTTCARDPMAWTNDTAEGADRVRGVLVRRFAVNQPYDPVAFQQLSARLAIEPPGRTDAMEWVRRLGPSSPGLIDYLKRQHRNYDAVVFFSLYHATTAQGLAVAADRSILFPFLTLDRALRFELWGELMAAARAVGYVSAAEKPLARRYVRAHVAADEIVGIGVEAPHQQTYPRHQQDPADDPSTNDQGAAADDTAEVDPLAGRGVPFRRRHRLYGAFALYGGPVDADNGCEEMLEYFDSFAAQDGDTALVLMGVKMMRVPDERYLRLAGVLPDRERMNAYEAAEVTIAPAADDLISQAVLESMAVGTPVLVSARNEAGVEHVRSSGGGLYYANRDEFVETLRLLMTDARLRQRLGENGRQYVKQHHRWDAVLARFDRLVTRARGR
jgi:glycosyltransferase involved in cell wall biosynthesis